MNWPMVQLGDIVNITTGKKDVNAGSIDGIYPFFTCAKKVYSIDSYTFDNEAILVAGNGDFNVKYYNGKFDAYQRTYVLTKKKPGVNLKFVFEVLKAGLPVLTANNQGSTIKYLKMNDFVRFPMPLPDLPTQEKITRVLQSIDEAISSTVLVFKKTSYLKRGVSQYLFDSYLDNEISLKDSGIKIIDGDRGNNYPKQKDLLSSGYCVFLSTPNVNAGTFDFTSVKFINKDRDELLRKGKLSRNDVVLTTRGTVGKLAWFNNEVIYDHIRINSGMVIIRCGEDWDAGFVLQLFLSNYMQSQMLSIASGSAQPQLPISSLNNIKVIKPPIEEQRKIARVLINLDEKSQINHEFQVKHTVLQKTLATNLIAGKVSI